MQTDVNSSLKILTGLIEAQFPFAPWGRVRSVLRLSLLAMAPPRYKQNPLRPWSNLSRLERFLVTRAFVNFGYSVSAPVWRILFALPHVTKSVWRITLRSIFD